MRVLLGAALDVPGWISADMADKNSIINMFKVFNAEVGKRWAYWFRSRGLFIVLDVNDEMCM